MTITRIEATNVFCFSTFAMDLPHNGAVIEGGNGRGKTSVLNLIRTALVEKGATKDMIKKGSDKGEIMVRVDGHFVKRVMNGGDKFRTTLRVMDPDGKVVPEPAAFLKNLLGLSPLDPIELFLERDKGKRRARILSAIPVSVTAEQLAAWCPPGADLAALVGVGRAGVPDVSGHGLEVVERARKALYAQRTEVNRLVKERQAAADQAIASEGAAYDALSAFRVQHGIPNSPVDLDQARKALDESKRAAIALEEQRRSAEQSAKGQAKTREKIAALRQKASDLRANQPLAPKPEQFAEAAFSHEAAKEAHAKALAVVEDLERQLATARLALEHAGASVNAAAFHITNLQAQSVKVQRAVDDIADIEGQALELEQALGALPIAPSEAQFVEVERATTKAAALVEYATKSAALATQAETSDKARALLRAAQEDAAALDRSVKALADEAPAALLAAADGIKGLTIDGDDIFLDGVSLDQLSGQERLFFAVEVARRLNAKSKLLCVDGLEALDAEHRKAFIDRATEGGFQLIATRVSDLGGDPVPVPIQAEF